ncbi:MAG TPA: hypothetical protein VGS41_14110 [Chthonomonadales bacterium]|nr:hypothetical protein [Chthonomonadales bacterium]
MELEKKRIIKPDGRYLIYYHFPESATEEQTAEFAACPAVAEPAEPARPTTSEARSDV